MRVARNSFTDTLGTHATRSFHEIGLLAPTMDRQPVLALRPEYRHHGDNALQPVAVFQLTPILFARSRRFSRHDQPVIVGPEAFVRCQNQSVMALSGTQLMTARQYAERTEATVCRRTCTGSV